MFLVPMKFFVAASSKDLHRVRQQTEQSEERDNFFTEILFSSKEDLKKEIVFTPFPNNRSPMEIHAGMLWKARSCNWNIGKDLKKQIVEIYYFSSDFPTNEEKLCQSVETWPWKMPVGWCKRSNLQLAHIKNTKISFFTFTFFACKLHNSHQKFMFTCLSAAFSFDRKMFERQKTSSLCLHLLRSFSLLAPVDLHKFQFLLFLRNFSANETDRAVLNNLIKILKWSSKRVKSQRSTV